MKSPDATAEMVEIYGVQWSAWSARYSRWLDLVISISVYLALMAAFHLHMMLTVGDWDFWVDWKDRQYWVTVTPILAITFPAAFQYLFWEKLRLPIAATLSLFVLVIGEWTSRIYGFNLWSNFPFSMIWPSTMIASALVLDITLLLTGNFLLTSAIGGIAFALLFYPTNWPMLAPYRLPMEVMGNLVSVGDYIGYAFTRTATPEYLRYIERGTLRTFGGHSAMVAAFFSGFACMLTYLLWWYMGKFFTRVFTAPNRLKGMMGFKDAPGATSP